MPWYIYSLLAVFIGSFGVIAAKWALNLGINKIKFLTIVFVGIFACYFLYTFQDLSNLITSSKFITYLEWGFLAGALSFLGNLAEIKSYEESPNPGYIKAITSVNAILILLAAALLFGSPVGLTKLIGSIIIIAGLLPLLDYRSGKKNGLWQVMALLAMLCYGALILVAKQMGNLGFSAQEILLILFFFACLGFVILYFFKGRTNNFSTSSKVYIPILIYIVISFAFNLLVFIAVNLAPNAGYSSSIGNASVILVLILSIIFFPRDKGGEFNLYKWMGAFLIVLGVILTVF